MLSPVIFVDVYVVLLLLLLLLLLLSHVLVVGWCVQPLTFPALQVHVRSVRENYERKSQLFLDPEALGTIALFSLSI